MAEASGRQLGTVGALCLSVISSVAIVICNKALISNLGFSFATTLTSWHLIVTFCSLHIARWMQLFEQKPFDSRTVMGFGILNGISIGLLNLCLGFNSVGFYQMSKLAIIPCTVFLEISFFGKRFSQRIQLSLVTLLVGVGIATITDLQLNMLGSIIAIFAIMTTCVAQIVEALWSATQAFLKDSQASRFSHIVRPVCKMTNTIQKNFKVSSTQLLYQSCPYQAVTLFIIGPFLDAALTKRNVFAFNYNSYILMFIIMSCMISVSVNFSTFLVLGKTSAVTYQVLGHLKTCLILALGYLVLANPFSWRNVCGILIALSGMALYSHACILESQQKAQENSTVSIQAVKESDILDPLVVAENGTAKVLPEDENDTSELLWNKSADRHDLKKP